MAAQHGFQATFKFVVIRPAGDEFFAKFAVVGLVFNTEQDARGSARRLIAAQCGRGVEQNRTARQ